MKDWILVVDDDLVNLKMASKILTAENLRVNCLSTGEMAVKYLKDCKDKKPDLILLDIHMPGMDGFETFSTIQSDPLTADIPVIFLTADEDSATETRGLQAGAMDFIKKPFVPKVLSLRVRHTIDLVRLQTNLYAEVGKMTQRVIQQNEKLRRMSTQIVVALMSAIDAKDKYTKGHSIRVAVYAKEIAKRAGFSKEEQENIYMSGLLHDVGKIGIPDAIINKPGKLTNEEFELVKDHPNLGVSILEGITEMPNLVVGAKWHHERYDGKGYPDGIAGENIPIEARIITIADYYDAMSSRRSYRDIMPQAEVRSEIENGKGTQFDPRLADIMLGMIDEDKDYDMREKL